MFAICKDMETVGNDNVYRSASYIVIDGGRFKRCNGAVSVCLFRRSTAAATIAAGAAYRLSIDICCPRHS